MSRIQTIITVDLTNVSREEQQELRDYLEGNYWNWREKDYEADKKPIGFSS
mgnify:CR=1 FL=1